MDGSHHPGTSNLTPSPTLLALGTAQNEREAGQSSSTAPDQNQELSAPNHPSAEMPGEALEGSSLEEEQESANGQNHSPDLLPLPQEEPEPEQGDPEPNMMEPMSDRRGTCKNFLFIPDVLIHFQPSKDQFAVWGGCF